MKYRVPEVGEIELDTIILDLNGTLSVNGMIVDGVQERFGKLKKLGFKLYLLSGDQRGTATEMCKQLGIDFFKAKNAQEKENFVKNMNSENVVSIGNGRIDIGIFKESKISIATLQSEGIHPKILEYCDILVPNINDALDILLSEDSFNATMRT